MKVFIAVTLLVCIGVTSALTHAEALKRLQEGGVKVHSSKNCSDRNKRGCTSLDGIRENTIDKLLVLKRASGCEIVVTGGTEIGHAGGEYSHGSGYKADIRLNPCINDYITKRFDYIGKRRDGADMYTAASGNVYAREGNHWDILFKN